MVDAARIRFVLGPLALCLAGAAIAAEPSRPTAIAVGDAIVSAAGLPAECPLERTRDVPVFFAYVVDGPWYRADFAVVVPGAAEDVARWLLEPATYGDWAFTTPAGEPNLRDIEIDEAKGVGSAQVGPETWHGSVGHEASGSVRALRLGLLDESAVKEAYVEVTLRPVAACAAGASLVTGRVAWRLGWLARLFGGHAKAVPGVFSVRLRDDILARALAEPEARAALLGDTVREGDPAVFTHGAGGTRPAPGDRLLRIAPAVTDCPAVAELADARAEKKSRLTATAFVEALDGRSSFVGYLATVERAGQERPVFLYDGTDDAYYAIRVVVGDDKESSSMKVQLGRVPG